MKREDKELLLKDLSARLPYGVIVEIKSYTQETSKPWFGKLSCKDLDCFIHDVAYESIKPYLRPISSMTKEEKKELSARWLWTRCFDNINLAYLCDSAKDYVACSSGEYFELQDWLNAHHFDYRGLIPKGLAIEAPKDMYNEIEEEKK